MSQHPEISYTHVLSELSVNRKDPCEVIRELISNSYDAGATRIEIYPLLQEKGFIFFDNGTGLSEKKESQGITPYKAFFSIGKSTKIRGESIGYKCQGSKLCFASRKFTLITRCKGEDKDSWRSITIDNPKDNLNERCNIEPQEDYRPWETLKNLVRMNDKTRPILEHLNENFFRTNFASGAMLIVQGLDVEKFSDFYDPNEERPNQWSYLKNYIRFNTRHGDVRILRPETTGFPASKAESFKKTPGYNDRVKLYLWTKKGLEEVQAGYPYLPKPDEQDQSLIRSPQIVSRLNDGRFSSRAATTFEFEETTYCLILAIDGNRRALEKYEELGRQGKKKSRIRLTDQRGTFICSEGVKICQFNQLFEHPQLQDYAVLGTSSGQEHYIFMISGCFDVVTNRNSLAEAALNTLNKDTFVDNIKQFFVTALRNDNVFRELIDRLNKDNQAPKLEQYTQKMNALKDRIKYRKRFMVQDIEQLKEMWLVEPEIGEEHWVGSLYTMFAHLVHPDSPYAHFWLRPLTFSCLGIDSIAVSCGVKSVEEDAPHKALEYKYSFSAFDEFNHPLILTEQVVCWEMPEGEEGSQIKDSYAFYGYVSLPKPEDDLYELGYEIIKIKSQTGDSHGSGKLKVISLKELLSKTFKCEWETPPPKATDSPKGKKGNKSK